MKYNLFYFIPGLFMLSIWLLIVYKFGITNIIPTNLEGRWHYFVNILIWGIVGLSIIDLTFREKIITRRKKNEEKRL